MGPKGQRVAAIVDELRGEKIDIIKWSEDPAQFIAAALAPSDVVDVMMAEEGKAAASSCLTISCLWPSARRARTLAWPPVSPAIRSISSRRAIRVRTMRRSWTRNPSSDTVEFLSLRRGCGYRSAVPAAQQKKQKEVKPGAVRRAMCKGGCLNAESEKDPPAAMFGLPGE